MRNSNIHEGTDSPKHYDCEIPKCDFVDFSSLKKEEDLMDIKYEVIAA